MGASLRWHDRLVSPPQRIPAHHIARRTVATDQIIPTVAAHQGTADAPGCRPDYLGIMADIAPIAGGAVFGKQTAFIIAVFLDPGTDHIGMIISVARAHPEIFALPFAAAGLAIMRKSSGPGHRARIIGGIRDQFLTPDQIRRTNLGAGLIMGAHHYALQRAHRLRGGSRNDARCWIGHHARLRLHRGRRLNHRVLIGDLRRDDGTGR